MKRAIVFPGQGSQHRGMGAALFAQYPALVAEADRVLGYSIRDVCLSGPGVDLGKTEITQPAVYVVSMLEYQRAVENNGVPDVVAGHSLGEYAALAAAGVFSFATGLRIVQRRGTLMGAAYGGGLVAIIGADERAVDQLLREDGLEGIEIANVNSPEQVVVGGRKDKLQDLLAACAARSLRAVPLRVSGAFHTSHMADAAREFSAFLEDIEFAPPRVPVVANVDGRLHDLAGLRKRLVEQMVKPVRWSDCVETMLRAGVTEFIEVGPARVLTPLIASIRRAWEGQRHREAAPQRIPEVEKTLPIDSDFCKRFACARPLVVGSLGHGMAGASLVKALANAGVLAFLDTEGLELEAIDGALGELMDAEESAHRRIGVSLRADLDAPQRDEALVDCLLRHKVCCIEVRGYAEPTEPLKRYRNARNGGLDARILPRVGTLEALAAFLSGSLPVERIKRLPDPEKTPWADAICIDLDCWRSRQGAPLEVLLSALQWKDAYRRLNGAEPFFVGISGTSIGSSHLQCDFTLVGSVFLLSREARLDEQVKELLLAEEARLMTLPDWRIPELETRALSFACDRTLSNVAERLQEIYVQGTADAREMRKLASEVSEPFRSRLEAFAADLAECADAFALRAMLRRKAKALLFPGIVECDGSLTNLRIERHKISASGIPAAELLDLLYPQSIHAVIEERRHG